MKTLLSVAALALAVLALGGGAGSSSNGVARGDNRRLLSPGHHPGDAPVVDAEANLS